MKHDFLSSIRFPFYSALLLPNFFFSLFSFISDSILIPFISPLLGLFLLAWILRKEIIIITMGKESNSDFYFIFFFFLELRTHVKLYKCLCNHYWMKYRYYQCFKKFCFFLASMNVYVIANHNHYYYQSDMIVISQNDFEIHSPIFFFFSFKIIVWTIADAWPINNLILLINRMYFKKKFQWPWKRKSFHWI